MTRRLAWLLMGLCACAGSGKASGPPSHEQLVNAHMQGDYPEVLRWCPVILEDAGAEPALSDWCLFGYPAALRLSLDNRGALDFMRAACTDLAGGAVGDESFRTFYVREVTRWFALPMRFQGMDTVLPRAVRGTVQDFSAACQVDPAVIEDGLDTTLHRRRHRGLPADQKNANHGP